MNWDCPAAASPRARREAGDLYQSSLERILAGDWTEAAAGFQGAVRLDPTHSLAHYGLGLAYMNLRRFSEAVQAFLSCRQAFRCQAAPPPEERAEAERTRAEAIRVLRDTVRTLEAQAATKQLIKWKEVNGEASMSTGQAAQIVHGLEGQIALLQPSKKQSLADATAPIEVSLALGNAYFHVGSLPDAERELRAALVTDPRSGDAHNNLAVVCMLTGRLDEAAAEVKRARKSGVSVSPRSSTGRY